MNYDLLTYLKARYYSYKLVSTSFLEASSINFPLFIQMLLMICIVCRKTHHVIFNNRTSNISMRILSGLSIGSCMITLRVGYCKNPDSYSVYNKFIYIFRI